jgi:formate hydrogenlyase transcriptional activator
MAKVKELEVQLKIASGHKKVDILNELTHELRVSNPGKAEDYNANAIKLAGKIEYTQGSAMALFLKAKINYIKGNLDDAQKNYIEAIRLYGKINDKKGIAASNIGLGRVNYDKCFYTEALDDYLKAIKICEEIGDNKGILNCYNSLALFYYGRGDIDESMNYLLKVLKLQETLGDTNRISLTYNRIGIIHKDKKEYDCALENYFRALELMGDIDKVKHIDLAVIYNNIGDCFEHKKEFEKALEYFEKSRRIAESLDYKDALILSCSNIGNIKAGFKEYESAYKILKKALQLSRETGIKLYEREILERLVDLFEKQDDYKQALLYHQQFAELKEILFNEEKSKQIAEMQARYESEKSKREVEIYRLKNVELAREIAERKKVEAELKKYQGQLEELVKERTGELRIALDEVERLKNRLQEENIYLQEEIKLEHNFNEIVGRSRKLNEVLLKIEQVGSTDSTVLILGETGTGKELIARAIHGIGDRKNRPLVKVNCAALPATLIESELFGHEKGAFTGAYLRKIGRFELADHGTILLDEIGELPLELQAKLLRVLQEGEFERIGGSKSIKVDVRIIAVTNRDLARLVKDNKFRDDLYYRLNVFPIKVPSLRERKEDIPVLANHFILKYRKIKSKKIEIIPQNVMDMLKNYSWPGNVRELENIIERSAIISQGNQLALGEWFGKEESEGDSHRFFTLEQVEKEHIQKSLEKTNWRISGNKGAAKILGLKPTTLEAKMKKLGIRRPGS